MLIAPFDMCLPALSRLVLTTIDRCLQQQLGHQGGVAPVGIPSLLNDHSLMLNDQALVRQSIGPQRDTTAAAVASLVVVATIFIRERRKSPSAAWLLPKVQAFALSLSTQVFRCIECVCRDRLGGVAVVLAASLLQLFRDARPYQLADAATKCAILTGQAFSHMTNWT